MVLFNGMASSLQEMRNAPIAVKVCFSENKDIEEIQKKGEEIKIHDVIQNIVNLGNPNQNLSGSAEWEACTINYQPVTRSLEANKSILAKITMSDGTILYESLLKSDSVSKFRYTETFRFGKWVDRLVQYSEELTEKYLAEVKKKKLEEKIEKMKPFTEVDF